MAIDSSKFFDSIRIKPNKLSAKQQAQAREEAAMCEWAGCQNKGPHRAPKGRENSREYFHFCLNHVREYNQNYNFFQGMNADAVARYQKDALTGHRPTWKMGANTAGKKGKQAAEDFDGASDPFSMFSELNGRGRWRPGPGYVHYSPWHCPDSRRTRPDQPPAALLLAGMRGPAGGARDREDRRKRLPRDFQRVEQDRGEELDVGIQRALWILFSQRAADIGL